MRIEPSVVTKVNCELSYIMPKPTDINSLSGKSLFLTAKNIETTLQTFHLTANHFWHLPAILSNDWATFCHLTMLKHIKVSTLQCSSVHFNHIRTQHDFLYRPTSGASAGCVNFCLGSSTALLLTLFATGVFVA